MNVNILFSANAYVFKRHLKYLLDTQRFNNAIKPISECGWTGL